MTDFAAQVDARQYAPKYKHNVIFKTFEELEPGTRMELINDHDPRPLYYQFTAERPDQLKYIQRNDIFIKWYVISFYIAVKVNLFKLTKCLN